MSKLKELQRQAIELQKQIKSEKKRTHVFIGVNIQKRRKLINMNQDEFAIYLGLSRTQISNIERGDSQLTLDNLMEICSIFECTPNDIILGKDYMENE